MVREVLKKTRPAIGQREGMFVCIDKSDRVVIGPSLVCIYRLMLIVWWADRAFSKVHSSEVQRIIIMLASLEIIFRKKYIGTSKESHNANNMRLVRYKEMNCHSTNRVTVRFGK